MGYTFVESDLAEVVTHFSRFSTVAFDLETSGLSPHDSRILLAQVGFPDHQYVIDATKVDLQPLMPFLASQKWQKILFNGKFDEQFTLKNFNTPILSVFDCMIAERVIAPESKWGNSFEDLALHYLNIQLDKNVRKSFYGKQSGTFTEEQIKYAAEDVEHLFPLMEMQVEKLAELRMTHVAELEFSLITVISNMELTGVPINTKMWSDIMQEYVADHEESRKKMLGIFMNIDEFDQQLGFFGNGPETPAGKKPLNINSPLQLNKAFAELGIKVADTKEQTIAKIDHPAAKALMEYRKLDKLVTSYGNSFLDKIHPFTGRIHPDWKQVGTETGRFSCRAPNMQQIPAKLRGCIGGDPNYAIIGADFSQMELRILAEESKDPILMDSFQSGKDVHSVTASTMFNIPIETVTKEQRFTAKTLNFGITYGMKVKKFVDMMNGEALKEGRKPINMREGSRLIDRYRETYKVANRWLESVGLLSLQKGMTQTRFGRKRFFTPVSTALPPDAFRGQIEAIKRQGANMPIQGTNADITKIAMVLLHEDLRDYGYNGSIILQVHDEIVVLAHKTQVEAIMPMITSAMTAAGQRLLKDIPVVVDAYAADYWSK